MKVTNLVSTLFVFLLLSNCNEEEQLPPAKPELETPANNSVATELNLTFKWKESKEADKYNFQLSLQNDFSTAEFYKEDLSVATLDIKDLKPSLIYYWRVNAENESGVSPWSSSNTFTTKSLSAPTLLAPADNSTVPVNNITFEWNTSSDASGYNLQVSTSADFSSFVLNKANLPANTFSLSGLMYSTDYFWRISSVKNNTNSSWSTARKFSTEPLSIPSLINPADGTIAVTKTITFEWSSVSGATGYNLQASETEDFLTLALNKSNLTLPTFSSAGLKSNTKYYWRANAMVSNCQSEWSDVWFFSTPTIPTEGLVAWYPFNGNANDESGNENHGIISGPTLTTDRLGNINSAYEFDGINDFIKIINPSILNFPDGINFTVSFFYNPGPKVTNVSGFNGIVSRFHNNIGPANGWQIGRDANNLRFESTNPCGNNNLTTLTTGSWIYVLQIYDRVNGVIKTYQNGVLINSTNCSSILSSMINNYDLKIGVEREGYQFSSGKIDDIRIYNRALTSEEILALYNK